MYSKLLLLKPMSKPVANPQGNILKKKSRHVGIFVGLLDFQNNKTKAARRNCKVICRLVTKRGNGKLGDGWIGCEGSRGGLGIGCDFPNTVLLSTERHYNQIKEENNILISINNS